MSRQGEKPYWVKIENLLRGERPGDGRSQMVFHEMAGVFFISRSHTKDWVGTCVLVFRYQSTRPLFLGQQADSMTMNVGGLSLLIHLEMKHLRSLRWLTESAGCEDIAASVPTPRKC